ncbi:MAG: murein biosynthesis integral membrane protein MurJ [Bdellovibrionales bacterium]|nr:murein biosynthesis integral membrane protein MurJ [Bdellovibrionales bacterium]
MKKTKKNIQKINLQATLMSIGTLLSRILGFLRDLFIANFFSKTETDIFFVAFRFPNFFRRILGEGTFTASITPALTENLNTQGWEETKKLHNALSTLLFSIVIVITVLGIFFIPYILKAFFENSAYSNVEAKLEKTILIGRLVFTYFFFVSFYSYFMSVAQVFGKFFIPAVAPAFFNLSLILFAWTPQSWWAFPSMSLAWAVILGGFLQILPTLYEMKKLNLLPQFSFHKKKELKQILKRFLPGMLGLSGLSCISLINVYFTGSLEEGANSYIYYGDRLMEFPRALIALSIGSALIPEFTKQYTQKNIQSLKETLSYYLRFILFLTLPFSLLFFLQSETIIQFIFGRGQFDRDSVIITAHLLKIYALVLIFSSLSRILSSCLFALNKNWLMTLGALFFVGFHFLCAFFLTPLYGLNGLIFATALSSLFFFLILIFCLFFLVGSLNLKSILSLLFNIAPGLLALALSLLLIPNLFSSLHFFLTKNFFNSSLDVSYIPLTFSDFLKPLNLNYISSYPFISFIFFSFSCLIAAFLYLRLNLFCKEPISYDVLKLLTKMKSLKIKKPVKKI